MSPLIRLGAFGAGLLAVFAAALGVGRAVGPVAADQPASGHSKMAAGQAPETAHSDQQSGHQAMEHGGATGADSLPGGLMVSSAGYTLQPISDPPSVGVKQTFAFRIVGPDGRAATGFAPRHDKKLHLIVVSRDLSRFRHVHPRMDTDGTWRVPLRFDAAGDYRIFADFVPTGGKPLTLGTDVAVAGSYHPRRLPAVSTVSAVDGYTVKMTGTLRTGSSSTLTFTVSRDGRPVTDLQPYLAAYGHLVVLRADDLAYLHVHPDGAPGDGHTRPGPRVGFEAEAPSPGRYRLFLDFKHRGVVRTADFTVTVGYGSATSGRHDSTKGAEENGHGHD